MGIYKCFEAIQKKTFIYWDNILTLKRVICITAKTKHKAQAAMEFLMTYGWAIIVVLVVIAALAYLGILSPTKLLPGKCQFQIGMLCKDVTAAGDELEIGCVSVEGVYPIFFDRVNRMGEPIYVTKINVSSRSGLECMQIQIEECTAEQRSFIEPLFGPAGTTFDSFADCISVQEACDNIGCGAIEPNRMLRWS